MSPNVCKSNVAYAEPSLKCPASIEVTHAFFGNPGTLPTTFFQVFPPSRVTCRLPSSVPTHTIFGFLGDSEMEKIVVCISAEELSTVTPPECSCCCFIGLLVVKSGEM